MKEVQATILADKAMFYFGGLYYTDPNDKTSYTQFPRYCNPPHCMEEGAIGWFPPYTYGGKKCVLAGTIANKKWFFPAVIPFKISNPTENNNENNLKFWGEIKQIKLTIPYRRGMNITSAGQYESDTGEVISPLSNEQHFYGPRKTGLYYMIADSYSSTDLTRFTTSDYYDAGATAALLKDGDRICRGTLEFRAPDDSYVSWEHMPGPSDSFAYKTVVANLPENSYSSVHNLEVGREYYLFLWGYSSYFSTLTEVSLTDLKITAVFSGQVEIKTSTSFVSTIPYVCKKVNGTNTWIIASTHSIINKNNGKYWSNPRATYTHKNLENEITLRTHSH